MLEKQATNKATVACMEEEVVAAKRRALQVADNKLKRKKAQSTLELLKTQRNEAPRLPIQSPLVSALAKRMCTLHTPSATVNRSDR